MTKLLAALFVALFFFCGVPLFAEPIVNVKTEYYDVHGSNFKEVRESVDQHSRMTHNFGNRDALTCTKFTPKWGNPPTVTLDITFIMPRWVECSQAPKDMQKKWLDYVDGVQLHENEHFKINEECARAVEKKMLAESPRPGRTFNRDITAIYTMYSKKQLEYDRITKHGQTQGPCFPY